MPVHDPRVPVWNVSQVQGDDGQHDRQPTPSGQRQRPEQEADQQHHRGHQQRDQSHGPLARLDHATDHVANRQFAIEVLGPPVVVFENSLARCGVHFGNPLFPMDDIVKSEDVTGRVLVGENPVRRRRPVAGQLVVVPAHHGHPEEHRHSDTGHVPAATVGGNVIATADPPPRQPATKRQPHRGGCQRTTEHRQGQAKTGNQAENSCPGPLHSQEPINEHRQPGQGWMVRQQQIAEQGHARSRGCQQSGQQADPVACQFTPHAQDRDSRDQARQEVPPCRFSPSDKRGHPRPDTGEIPAGKHTVVVQYVHLVEQPGGRGV